MLNQSVRISAILILFILIFSPFLAFSAKIIEDKTDNQTINTATLEECIQTALKNSRLRPASRYAVEMAEAQHRQALAGYWPQVNVRGGYQRMDESQNFIFPSSDITLPMGGTIPITIPGIGTVPVNSVSVPVQDVKLMDEESYKASLNTTWLLYDGGMRKGYREQTSGLIKVMEQESRRTDLEIIDSVKRLYYGSVLASRLIFPRKSGHEVKPPF